MLLIIWLWHCIYTLQIVKKFNPILLRTVISSTANTYREISSFKFFLDCIIKPSWCIYLQKKDSFVDIILSTYYLLTTKMINLELSFSNSIFKIVFCLQINPNLKCKMQCSFFLFFPFFSFSLSFLVHKNIWDA